MFSSHGCILHENLAISWLVFLKNHILSFNDSCPIGVVSYLT